MINIIGAGMAGSIMAKLLRREGIEFRIFDAGMKKSASRISENLIGFDWYKELPELKEKALKTLTSITGYRVIDKYYQFPRNLLLESYEPEWVEIGPDGVSLNNGKESKGFNIVCKGVWDANVPKLKAVNGAGLEFSGQINPEIIKPWRVPFRLEKLINVSAGVYWYSQSLAVNNKTLLLNEVKFREELENGAKAYGLTGGEFKTGARPFAEHRNIYLKNSIRINGGGKSGLLHYPNQCLEALEYLKQHKIC